MRYRKLIRFPIVAIILLSHGINPFGKLADTIPQIRQQLSNREKEYIINTCLDDGIADCMRSMFYED